MGIRARAVHLGGTYWRIQPDDTDVDQYYRPGSFLQQADIQRGVLSNENDSCGRRAGGSVNGYPGPNPGLYCIGNALPWDKRVGLQGYYQ